PAFATPDAVLATARPVGRTGGRHAAAPPAAPLWRRLGFAAAIIVLVAAIPVLGVKGYRLVTNSTDGRFVNSSKSPGDPGYEELVTSTPTALVMQKDADGAPVNLALVSLSGNTGGHVIFIPLETAVRKPAFGVDRIARAYGVLEDRPA